MARESNSSFYDELIKQDFYSNQVDSSKVRNMSKEAASNMLESFSDTQMEALAEEFDNLFTKEANTSTLEDEILQSTEEGEEEVEELEGEEEKEAAEKELPAFIKEKMEGKKGEEKKEEKKESKKSEKTEDKDEEEKEEDKEASEDEERIIKEAYDLGLNEMQEKGLTVYDYAFAQIGDEKVAGFIAEKSEKLAYITETNPLQIVDDILKSIEDQLEEV